MFSGGGARRKVGEEGIEHSLWLFLAFGWGVGWGVTDKLDGRTDGAFWGTGRMGAWLMGWLMGLLFFFWLGLGANELGMSADFRELKIWLTPNCCVEW